MQETCIVTDTSAQFPKHKGGWEKFVRILPFHFTEDKTHPTSIEQSSNYLIEASTLPKECLQRSLSPSDQTALKSFLSGLANEFRQVLFILPTQALFPSFAMVTQTLKQMNLPAEFIVIDSRSLGYGLGWLIQACVNVFQQGDNLIKIKRFLHHKIPRIYTLVYFSELTPLKQSKVLDPDQALVGEYLGIRPLILLENNQILPYQKVRNFKHLVDCMLEYVHEFDQIEYLGLHFGSSICLPDRKILQNRLQSITSQNQFDIQVMSPYLDEILGSQAICMVLIESDNKHEI